MADAQNPSLSPGLSPAKQALLQIWKRGSSNNVKTSIPVRPNLTWAPLSFTQERALFLGRTEPGLSTDNFSNGVCMTGPLDLTALQSSLNEIMRRHSVLRTFFRAENGQVVQIISPITELPLRVINLQNEHEADREKEAERHVLAMIQEPFDLRESPLLRAGIVQLGPDRHWMVITIHLIIADCKVWDLFFDELTAHYLAFSSGNVSPLPEPAIQYADYAAWQRQQWTEGPTLEEQLAYWSKQLADLSLLKLPFQKPGPAIRTYVRGTELFALDPAISKKIHVICAQEKASPFAILLAVWDTLLYCYSEQTDLVVCSYISSRNRPELEKLLGCFLNNLAMRVSLADNPSFQKIIKRAQDVIQSAYAHQELPFEKLVQKLYPQLDRTTNPLAQVGLAYHDDRPEVSITTTDTPVTNFPLALEILNMFTDAGSTIDAENREAEFDLLIAFRENLDGLSGAIGYDVDLFDKETVNAIASAYQKLIALVFNNPELCLDDVRLMLQL